MVEPVARLEGREPVCQAGGDVPGPGGGASDMPDHGIKGLLRRIGDWILAK